MTPRRADDAELELAARHLLDHGLRVGDREGDREARVPALELAEQERNDRPAGPGRGAELERAVQLTLLALGERGE